MNVGLIGSGNMTALASRLGPSRAVLNPLAERAQALAAEMGGEALPTNAEVARRAGFSSSSVTSRRSSMTLRAKSLRTHAQSCPSSPPHRCPRCMAHTPDRRVYRFIPSLPVEARRGPSSRPAIRAESDLTGDVAADTRVRELFAELGTLVVLPDALSTSRWGLMSCAPAYVALVAEAQIDAGVRSGIPAAQGAELVVQTARRHRRAAAPSRQRHGRCAPRGHLAGG